MNKRIFCAITGAILALAFFGCGPRVGVAPGPVDAAMTERARQSWPDVTLVELEQGRQIFLDSCNRCHEYPDRKGYSAEEWPEIIDEMGEKAELEKGDRERVLRFVLTSLSDPAP